MNPLFICDWERILFVHYEANPTILQKQIPFDVDLFQGKAYVSCVAFTMTRVRPQLGGQLTESLVKPFSDCRFLNVRTYIRYGQHTGIYFMKEWVSNRLNAFLAPKLYRLPCYYGAISYDSFTQNSESFTGMVLDPSSKKTFQFKANIINGKSLKKPSPQSLDEFLMERYCSLTNNNSGKKIFRIEHKPWLQYSVPVKIEEDSLMAQTGDWFQSAKLINGNFAYELHDIKIWSTKTLREKK